MGSIAVSIRQPSKTDSSLDNGVSVTYSIRFGQSHSVRMNFFASQWDLILNTVILTGTQQHLQGHVQASFRHVTHRQVHIPQLEDWLSAWI